MVGIVRIRRFLDAVDTYDRAIFRAVTLLPTPRADRVLRRVSQVANGSALWSAVAALLAALGRKRGRRAARSGLISLGLAAFVANVPVKMAARRHRPVLVDVPLVRRLRRAPRSSSFPSGHSASAFAFATAAALEWPWLAAPVGVLAAGVAYSRIHTGVHYPSDVVVGSAIGIGSGLMVHRLTSSRSIDEAAITEPRSGVLSPDGEGLVVVVNPSVADGVVPLIRAGLPNAQLVEVDEGTDLEDAFSDAAAHARVLGVAGGDGTVCTAANVALDRDIPLIVIPAGTLNHFARAIGIASIDDAIKAIREGAVASVDAAEIAGRTFLNTASVGIYSDLVDIREQLEGRFGKWLALVIALARVLRRARPTRLEIDGRSLTVWLAFAGNCRYSSDGLAPTRRERLDDGSLDVRYVLAGRRFGRLRLLGSAIVGRLDRTPVYNAYAARSINVRSLDTPVRLAYDGETFDGPSSFEIRKRNEHLRVVVPRRLSQPPGSGDR